MATRFYFPSAGTSDVAPTITGWTSALEDGTQPSRPLVTTKSDTPLADVAHAEAVANNPARNPVVQFVSAPLTAQTIGGDFSGVVMGRESSTSANASLAAVLRVVSGDGLTERGVLYAPGSGFINTTSVADVWGSEFGTALSTRTMPVTALTPVDALEGDRLVVEVGGRHENGSTTSYTTTLRLGDPAATADYARTPGLTAADVGWIELSQTLTFSTGASSIEGTVAAASGTSGTLAVSIVGGSVQASSGVCGALPVSAVAGAVATSSSAAGAVLRSTVSGIAVAASATVGSVTRSPLAGVVAAVSAAVGAVAAAAGSLGGVVAAASATVGTVARSQTLGSIDAASGASGTLARSTLGGVVAALTGTVGTIARSVLAGTVDAISSVVGALVPGAAPPPLPDHGDVTLAASVASLVVTAPHGTVRISSLLRTLVDTGSAGTLTISAPVGYLEIP